MSLITERKNLGKLSAEKDSNLGEYFLDTHPAFQLCADFEDRRFLLVGRTGAGKSAILEYLKKDAQKNPDILVAHVNASSDNLKAITQSTSEFFDDPNNTQFLHLTYKIAWYYIIALESIRSHKDRAGSLLKKFWADFSYKDRAVESFIKKINQTMDWDEKSIVELFLDIAKRAKIEAELAYKKNSIRITLPDLIAQQSKFFIDTKRFVEQDLVKMLGKKSLYILIDEIDRGWDPHAESQQIFIRTLYEVLHSLSRIKSIKPLAAIRTNIFQEVDWKIQSIKINDDVINIEWTHKELRDFIEKRLSYAFNVPQTQVWGLVVDDSISFSYIVDRTLCRPRDLLMLFQLILNKAYDSGHEKVYKTSAEKVLDEYSEKRLKALEDEWENSYPNLVDFVGHIGDVTSDDELDLGFNQATFKCAMLRLKKELDGSTKDFSWFTSLVGVEMQDKQHIKAVAKKLYTIGIICLYDRGTYIFASGSNEYMPKLKRNYKIKISPVFLPYARDTDGW